MRVFCSVIVATLLLGGCSDLYEPKPHVTSLKDDAVLSSTASITNTFILDRKTPFVTCSQPAPDATFNQAEEGDVSFSLISFGSGREPGAETEQSQEAELVGRSPTVLITRELFFRLCEFGRNYGLNKEEAKDFYKQTLEAVKAAWGVEAGNTSVKIGETLTTEEVQKILGSLPGTPVDAKKPDSANQTSPSTVAEFCKQNPDADGC